MRLHLRGRGARLVGRPTTIFVDFDVTPGVNRVDVQDASSAFVPITSWSWSLKKAGVEVGTSTSQNPSFTSLVAGDDYRLTLTVSTALTTSDPLTYGDFTVDPGALATPTGLTAGTPSGLTIAITFDAAAVPASVEERRLYYSSSGTPTTSDSFISVGSASTGLDFVATGSGTWRFKLGDIAVAGLATDSALSSEAQAVISGGGTAPSAPTLNSVTAINDRRIDLAWTIGANIGSGNHKIYRVTGSDTGFTPDDTPLTGNLLHGELGAGVNSYSDQSVAASTQYTYKVMAINAAGSATSSGSSATTPEQGEWPDNRPGGMTTILSTDGSSKTWGGSSGGRWTDANYVTVVTDAASKYGSAIEKRYVIGDVAGWNGYHHKLNFPSNARYQRLYIIFVLRWSTNYQFHQGHQKITMFGPVGVAGSGNQSAFYPGMRASGRYYFRCQAGGNNGAGVGQYDPVDTGLALISGGAYHTVELDITVNSAPGVADGSLRTWIDGTEVDAWTKTGTGSTQHDLTSGVEWFGSDIALGSDLRFGGCRAFEYWGGSGTYAKTVDDNIRIAHFEYAGV